MRRLLFFLLLASCLFGQGQDSIRAVGGVLTINIVPTKSFYKIFVDQTITSTSFTGQVAGTIVTVYFLQDSTGHTVAFGGNIAAGCTVSSNASATTACQFVFDAANNQWTALGGGSGGITSVTSLPATCTPGTTTPVQISSSPFGIYYCTATNTWTADNPSSSVSPTAFGGKFDVKFIYDAAFTNNNATVTCPQNDCSFQCPGGVYPCTSATTGCSTPSFSCDVGKIIFGTADTNIGSSVGTGLVTAQNTISTVNSASSVTMSATATATCTVGSPNICDLAWGSQDDTTAINNAATFAWGTVGVCRALQFPSANYFFSSTILSMSITQLSQACGGAAGAVASSGVDTTQVGPEAFGQGPGNTVGIPLPNFTYANCVSNTNICIGNTGNLEIHDMGWNGLGQILNGRSDSNMAFLQLEGSTGGGSCTGSTGFNLALAGWGYSDTGTFGAVFGSNACGDPVYSNIVVERTGSTNCEFISALVAAFNAVACFGAPTRVLQLQCTNGNNIVNTYASEFVDLNVGGPVITQSGCVWNDFGSWINSTSSASTLYQNTSAASNSANFNGTHFDGNAGPSAQVFLGQASAGTTSIHVKNVTFALNATTKILNVNSATAYFDDGGNSYGTAGAASTISGPVIADGHSIKGIGTGTCTAASTLGLRVSGTSLTGAGITTACTSATLDAGVAVSGARTVNGLTCTSSATTVSVTCTVMLSHNGGAFAALSPSVTCTMTAATSCNDTAHYPAVADGDLLTLQITTGAAETGANIKAVAWWN